MSDNKLEISPEQQCVTPNGRKEPVLKSNNQDGKSENEKLEAASIVTEKGFENNSQKDGVQHKNISQIIFSAIQAIASIATVIMAILAWQTLVEMQTDRNNAYRPDLVVIPNSSEGRLLEKDELNLGKENIVFDYYSGLREMFPIREYSDTCICLERPYLVMRNIGKGTAKNVEVTFSEDWFEKTITRLNEMSEDGRVYYVDVTNSNNRESIHFSYSNKDKERVDDLFMGFGDIAKEKITYIGCDDDSVNVFLPELYGNTIALCNYELINDFYRLRDSEPTLRSYRSEFDLPDLVISIQYSDMQGKTYNQEIKIPWTFEYMCEKDPNSTDGKLTTMDVKLSFYDRYSR